MSRPPTPSKVLELKGAFKKDPNRKRDGEPKPTGEIGKAPEYFSDKEKNVWKEIIAKCPPGVLTNSDDMHVEICAKLMAEFRISAVEFNSAKLSQLLGSLGRLGMNPSDRTKLRVPDKPKANPFKEL